MKTLIVAGVITLLMCSCVVQFEPEVVDTYRILVSVIIFDGNAYVLTTAQLILMDGTTVLSSQDLEAETNIIELREDWQLVTLFIEKTGYAPYEQEFSIAQLKEYETTPLIVLLEPDNP